MIIKPYFSKCYDFFVIEESFNFSYIIIGIAEKSSVRGMYAYGCLHLGDFF